MAPAVRCHPGGSAAARALLRCAVAVTAMVLVLVGQVLVPPPTHAAGLIEVTGFGSNPGNLRMFTYVPDGLPEDAPLLVALHGCSQSAAGFDDEPGWTELADRWQFAVLLPEQTSANHGSSCFNWWEPADTTRGQGEVASVVQMVDRMVADHATDASRVFATGLSAGGAMTAALLATYPDVFAGGAIVAGLPYRCATTTVQAYSCMNPGRDLSPQQWGDAVRGASSHTGPWPRVSVWHGTEDTIVVPTNMTELVEQWTDVHGTDQVPDTEDTVAGYPHKVYRDSQGTAVVESYAITGMGHGQPVDPGAGDDECGVAAAWILDVDVCAAYHIGRWFGLDSADREPPTVTITSPTGGTVSGTVTITADADDAGVARVEFYVDGTLVDTDSTAPWETEWDTTRATNGDHGLHARAVDAAGNVATSATVTVTVTGGVDEQLVLDESFSDADGDGDDFDTEGWTSDWARADDNHDPQPTTSWSSHGHAASGAGCVTGLTTQALVSPSLTLGSAPVLSYARRLDLRAAVNQSTTASFTVRVGSTVVDEVTVTYADHLESSWTERTVDLSAFADQAVRVTFEVAANSNVCIEVTADAWVDDVTVGDADTAPDPDPTAPVSLVIENDDATDGYVKAYADGSDAEVGAYESSYGLAVGRGTDGRHNRTVFSFDTSAIPDTATITRAFLHVGLNSYSGDPWADPDGNRLVVDVTPGCFGACTIEATDWDATAEVSDAAEVARWTSGSTLSSDLSAAGLAAIEPTGHTQVRLRFALDPTSTAYVFLGRGTAASLHVEYLP